MVTTLNNLNKCVILWMIEMQHVYSNSTFNKKQTLSCTYKCLSAQQMNYNQFVYVTLY